MNQPEGCRNGRGREECWVRATEIHHINYTYIIVHNNIECLPKLLDENKAKSIYRNIKICNK